MRGFASTAVLWCTLHRQPGNANSACSCIIKRYPTCICDCGNSTCCLSVSTVLLTFSVGSAFFRAAAVAKPAGPAPAIATSTCIGPELRHSTTGRATERDELDRLCAADRVWHRMLAACGVRCTIVVQDADWWERVGAILGAVRNRALVCYSQAVPPADAPQGMQAPLQVAV